MKKRVYIVGEHHNVLREWCRHQEQGMHLLSFDQHIDFRPAFSSGKGGDPVKCLARHIPCDDVDAAILDLEKDEHIDFAIKSGMLTKAFVFSRDKYHGVGNVKTVPSGVGKETDVQLGDSDAAVVHYPEVLHPFAVKRGESQMLKSATSDGVLDEVCETFRKCGFDQDNYIFDFDCDFIRNEAAMVHGHFEILKKIIRGAKVITIAREPDCCDPNVPFEKVERWLKGFVQNCGDEVEITYDPFAGSH